MKYRRPTGDAQNLYLDALKQKHLLIAGTTGSGKSVLLNGIIRTALFSFPDEIQFILIDPKRVELSMYKNLPHTLMYASEPSDRINALQYAMNLCDNRYREMQEQRIKTYIGSHVYVIIDEWADLMTTQKRDAKPLVQRLAQIARASRIHVILCTQTPIASIIPTEVKCNFDSRFGLRTRSKQDSINIIGRAGLETLSQYGTAFYMTPKEETLYNIPYYTDEELQSMVEWWTSQKPKANKGLFARIFKVA